MSKSKEIKITRIISDLCKKNDIKYYSPNLYDIEQYKLDASRLAELYVDLKEMMGELYDIAERYSDFKQISDMINNTLTALDKADHELIYEAKKILKLKENKNESNI